MDTPFSLQEEVIRNDLFAGASRLKKPTRRAELSAHGQLKHYLAGAAAVCGFERLRT